MSRAAAGLLGSLLLIAVGTEAGMIRMIVTDLPYGPVWEAAGQALRGYPVERAADGVIVTAWTERAPRVAESGFERVAERVTLRVEAREPRITRVTVEVEAKGWRDGQWVSIDDTRPTAREILARVRAAQG